MERREEQPRAGDKGGKEGENRKRKKNSSEVILICGLQEKNEAKQQFRKEMMPLNAATRKLVSPCKTQLLMQIPQLPHYPQLTWSTVNTSLHSCTISCLHFQPVFTPC